MYNINLKKKKRNNITYFLAFFYVESHLIKYIYIILHLYASQANMLEIRLELIT